jgi:hypothetical protein
VLLSLPRKMTGYCPLLPSDDPVTLLCANNLHSLKHVVIFLKYVVFMFALVSFDSFESHLKSTLKNVSAKNNVVNIVK